MDTLSGAVERITYYNSENGYTVLRLRPDAKMAHRFTNKSSLNADGLANSDLEASVALYRDVAGFDIEGRYQIAGEWFDTLTHNQDSQIDVAMLRMGEVVLQLIEYEAGGGDTLELAHHQVGNPHLSITVDDVEARHADIVASGLHDPTPLVDIMGAGIRSFYVADPDGVPVEFLQMPR